MTVQILNKSMDNAAGESCIGVLEESAEVTVTRNVFPLPIFAVQGYAIIDESVYVAIRLLAKEASPTIYS